MDDTVYIDLGKYDASIELGCWITGVFWVHHPTRREFTHRGKVIEYAKHHNDIFVHKQKAMDSAFRLIMQIEPTLILLSPWIDWERGVHRCESVMPHETQTHTHTFIFNLIINLEPLYGIPEAQSPILHGTFGNSFMWLAESHRHRVRQSNHIASGVSPRASR